MIKYTVIGAGHGGQALAAFLALQGAKVTLYNRSANVISNIKRLGRIELQGCVEGSVDNIIVTSELDKAISNADVIMVCIPSHHHNLFARNAKQYFKSGQIIILNPGRTLGAFYFDDEIEGTKRGIIVAETDTFLLTSRKIEDGFSKIFCVKKEVFLGAKDRNIEEVIIEKVKEDLGMLCPANSILYTSLGNIGAIFHPLPAILNIGRIECGEDFLHYKEGITPTVAGILEKLDAERLEIANKLGCSIMSAKDWIKVVYGSKGDSLYQVIQNTTAYDEVMAPKEISTRYIFEDIATGIVPMYCLAEELSTSNDILGLIIQLGTELFNYDFMHEGRNQVKKFLDYIEINKIRWNE